MYLKLPSKYIPKNLPCITLINTSHANKCNPIRNPNN